jgi:hypothetical protein
LKDTSWSSIQLTAPVTSSIARRLRRVPGEVDDRDHAGKGAAGHPGGAGAVGHEERQVEAGIDHLFADRFHVIAIVTDVTVFVFHLCHEDRAAARAHQRGELLA